MKRKSSAAGKPKLNLRNCKLVDEDLLLLVQALQEQMAVGKLELQGNSLTNIGAEALLLLLKDQLDFVNSTPIQLRMDVTLLGFINLTRQTGPSPPSPHLIGEIQYVIFPTAAIQKSDSHRYLLLHH